MRVLQRVARWVPVGGKLVIWTAGIFTLLVLFAGRFDPHRKERLQREAANELEAKVRAEAALAAMPAPITRDGVTEITWTSLKFVPLAGPGKPEPALAAQAPARITALDQKRIRISGFVLPTRTESGRLKEFLILENQMTCCFGQPPGFCDFIVAHNDSGPSSPAMDVPTEFEGTLHVHDVYANGCWLALYSMDCTRIAQDSTR